MRKFVPYLCAAALLAGCTAAQQTTVNTTIATAQADVQNAVVLYGISKGIAQVAAATNPSLAPVLLAGIATADPLVVKAQMAIANASTDAAAIEALVVQIKAQADALTVVAAPAVVVMPTAPGKTSQAQPSDGCFSTSGTVGCAGRVVLF